MIHSFLPSFLHPSIHPFMSWAGLLASFLSDHTLYAWRLFSSSPVFFSLQDKAGPQKQATPPHQHGNQGVCRPSDALIIDRSTDRPTDRPTHLRALEWSGALSIDRYGCGRPPTRLCSMAAMGRPRRGQETAARHGRGAPSTGLGREEREEMGDE